MRQAFEEGNVGVGTACDQWKMYFCTWAMRGPPLCWRLTGIEPATYSLSNCCSNHRATDQFLKLEGVYGRTPAMKRGQIPLAGYNPSYVQLIMRALIAWGQQSPPLFFTSRISLVEQSKVTQFELAHHCSVLMSDSGPFRARPGSLGPGPIALLRV